MIRHWLNKDTKEIEVTDELLDELSANSRWTDSPCHIDIDDASIDGVRITTTFIGSDARDRNLDLSHIKEPLVFANYVYGKDGGCTKTFWSSYEQAKLGREYWAYRYRVQELLHEIHHGSRSAQLGYGNSYGVHYQAQAELMKIEMAIVALINPIGAMNVESLIRPDLYVPVASRDPIKLPASGFPTDIEGFMQL
jgi:hypothetical protein